MTPRITPRNTFVIALLMVLALLPVYSTLTGNYFLVSLFTRILILSMAAVSLNLIMGFGGMVSFGHAVYLGIGGYVVGMLAKEGIGSGFVQWPLAIAVSGVAALGIGALCLRTRGVYFIMITLAFAQMFYYIAVGLERYGGDDGLTIHKRSNFGDFINLSNKIFFYYLCFAFLLATIYLVWRIVNSRFGLVIQGARSNDRRMRAIGFPTYRYKLTCFVIAGMVCGFAGVLLANSTDFISPAIMQWTRSGDLIVMVVLGGMGSVIGPVIGAVTLLVLEELLPYLMRAMVAVVLFVIAPIVTPGTYAAVSASLANASDYWQIILGPLLLFVVLFARGGIDGLLMNWRDVVAAVRGGIGRLAMAARGGINGLFASLRRG